MPVRDIALDDHFNRIVSGGDYLRADGVQAVKQGIMCRVGLFKGEYWLNTAAGVDYLNRILIRNAQPAVVQGEIGGAIAQTPDVTQVQAVTYTAPTFPARRASVTYTAKTTEGTITASVGAPS